MPQVPYTPYPTEQPAGPAQPSVNVSTPIDAFGGNIAQAVSHMGKVVEHAGDELFSRALAIQQLNNDAEAKEADAKYMIAAGELHANYGALQGADAAKAFPKYMQDLERTRADIRETLSNPAVGKIYDQSSRSTMGRSIFNGAGHAATQQKQYVIGTAKAQMDLDAKTVDDNPQDERLFQEKKIRIIENARTVAAAQGLPPGSPQEELAVLSATSNLRAAQIDGLAKIKPFEALEFLDRHRTELTPADFKRVDNTVRAQGRAVGSVQIAESVYNPNDPLKVLEDKAREQAKKLNPDDPLLEKQAVVAVQGRYNQNRHAERMEMLTNQEIVADGYSDGSVKNIQQLRANPKVAKAIDALPKEKQNAVPGQINRFNDSANRQTNRDNEQRIYGISNNDVEAFLNLDLTKEQLSQPDIIKYRALQQKLKENPNQDPRVDRARSWIRGAMGAQLEALGIYGRTTSNKDDFDNYTGALQSALDSWQASHNKPPTYKEVIEQIAPQLLKTRPVPGALFGSLWPNQKTRFQEDVPDKFAKDLAAEAIARGDKEPTPQETRRVYDRVIFNQLFGKKQSSGE